MKDFLKNVLANITAILILCALGFFFFIMMLVMGALDDSSNVRIKKNSVLTLDSKTRIIDSPTDGDDDIFSFRQQVKPVLLYDVLKAIEKAKTDDNIKGISIESDFVNAGLTQIDDIRAALEDFKKSGKFVYAYGNAVSQPSYYLGSVAQKYFLNPSGGIELKGMSAEVNYYKQMLDKYGIGVQVIRHGQFKAAVEPYLRDDMSPENRLQLSELLNHIWGNVSTKMAASRKIDTAQFRTVVDSLYGIIPENSVKYHLADQLAQKTEYENFIKNQLKIENKDKLNKVSFSKYIDSFSGSENKKSDSQVAVLYASGDIMNGENYGDIYSRNYVREIQKLQEDEDVKAVVLRINSPGGSANASDEILYQLKELRTKKPLIVSFGDYAASGGYYIAMAGDRIFSEPNTITGSIGVFGVIPYLKDVANKNGIHAETVKTNSNSNMISLINGLTPGGLSMMTQSVEHTYRRFVGFVMQNRKKTFDQVDQIGGGRVWSGTSAKEIGLVDQLGTLEDAIKFAAQKAKLNDYAVTSYPKKRNKFEQFFKANEDDTDLSAKLIKSQIGKENFRIYQQLKDNRLESSVMAELPYTVSFK